MPQIETSRPAIAERAAALLLPLARGVLIAGLVLADLSIARMILVFVLAVVLLASARFALRGRITALGPAGHLRPASAAEHPVLIMNLKSGGRPSDSSWPRNAGRGVSGADRHRRRSRFTLDR